MKCHEGHYLRQDPRPSRCKILKDSDTYVSGTETVDNVPDKDKENVLSCASQAVTPKS